MSSNHQRFREGSLCLFFLPDKRVHFIWEEGKPENLKELQKGKTMTVMENQEIILYRPRSNMFTAFFVGILALSIGLASPFLARWQFPLLLSGLLFIVGGVSVLVMVWQMLHHPILLLNAEGIACQFPFVKTFVRWEEVDSIYSFNARNKSVYAVDASPTGLQAISARQGGYLPRGMDVTIPQMVLEIPSTNLPLPVDQLLTLIRERFSAQLEQYHIVLDDGHGKNENF